MTTEMKTTHGMSRTPEHRAWAKMKERCFNPNNKDWHIYGGRGITVCERWRNSFEAFFEDMGLKPSPRHSLDRYPDQDGNYEPGNVRWATARQQALNLRVNRLVTVNGETLPLKEACRRLGIADRYKAVHRRMKKGATFEEARPS